MDTQTFANDVKQKAESVNTQRKEGKIAKAIESQTSRLPSDLFLWAAGTAMVASLTLKIIKKDHLALFVGQWAAPFLLLGVYNKMVKQDGHDQEDQDPD